MPSGPHIKAYQKERGGEEFLKGRRRGPVLLHVPEKGFLGEEAALENASIRGRHRISLCVWANKLDSKNRGSFRSVAGENNRVEENCVRQGGQRMYTNRRFPKERVTYIVPK